MSNYYKRSTRISDICKSITNTNTGIYNTYFINLNIPTGGTTTFTSTVDETPLTLGYQYKDTDISTYCIAAYVESSGTAFTSVPAWCTKIRAVLVGGGGGGAKGTKGNNAFTAAQQQNYTNIYNNDTYGNKQENNRQAPVDINKNEQVHQNRSYNVFLVGNGSTHYHKDTKHINIAATNTQTSGNGGGGGGGGSFVYLPNITIVPGASVNITKGSAGENTTLTVQTTTYTAAAGKDASGTSKGTGGTYTNSGVTNKDGDAGGDASGATAGGGGESYLMKISSLPYGKGGNGSAGTNGTPDVNNQGTEVGNPEGGTSGYYRIYFLTY